MATTSRRLLVVVGALLALVVLTGAASAVLLRERWLTTNDTLDASTRIAPSQIPGGGEGLFAARDFEAGEAIAEMGGRLVFYGTRRRAGAATSSLRRPARSSTSGPTTRSTAR